MSTTHTPEPWTLREASQRGIYYIEGKHPRGGDDWLIAEVDGMPDNKANAQRIVACVNALAGVPDPQQAIAAAREALERMLEFYTSDPSEVRRNRNRDKAAAARAALEQLKGVEA